MVAMVMFLLASGARATDTVDLVGGHGVIQFNLIGGGISRWQACREGCDNPAAITNVMQAAGDTFLIRPAGTDDQLDRHLLATRYSIESRQPQSLTLTSAPIANDVRLQLHYELLDNGRRLAVAMQLRGPGAGRFRNNHDLQLAMREPAGFGASDSAGFTGLVERTRWIRLTDGDVTTPTATTEPAEWAGIRNRFWTLIARQPQGQITAMLPASDNGAVMRIAAGQAPRFEFYAGSVEPGVLASQPADLQGLWIAAVWDWLRWLAMGLYYLLEWLIGLIGHHGLAIVALALSVKILMSPLTLIAGRWQQQVNRIQARLQPELQRIKAEYRGEEQANRVLTLHREYGVTPFYPIKSLFGVLIQLPVFIGVFDMLLHHSGLSGIPLLWIENLAQPDRLLPLPFELPFFGGYLNLLPFLMTGINVFASQQADAAGLDVDAHQRRRYWLYGMALLFFILFYTFPAAMVLYWTSSNLFHWLGERLMQYRRTRHHAA